MVTLTCIRCGASVDVPQVDEQGATSGIGRVQLGNMPPVFVCWRCQGVSLAELRALSESGKAS